MLQKAVRAGLIGRRVYEPGEQFDHAERMNWAVPVPGAVPVAEVKPDKKGKAKVAESDPPGDEEVI